MTAMKNELVIRSVIKVLTTTANYHDTLVDGMLTIPSFTRNPVSYLERVNAILLGLGSRSITETTSNELRFKARRFFDGAVQAASEDLRTYIIRFDNIVSNWHPEDGNWLNCIATKKAASIQKNAWN